MSDLIDCPLDFQAGVSKFGSFANAFRVMPEAGNECFLDFCVYSSQENTAEIVARIRVHQSFLSTIQERLSIVLQELSGKTELVFRNGLMQTVDGRLAWFTRGDDDPDA